MVLCTNLNLKERNLIDSRSNIEGIRPLFFLMIFIVIIIFGLLLFFVLGTDSFRKYAKKVSRRRRQNKLENNEPLKGYEKCSPQYQA